MKTDAQLRNIERLANFLESKPDGYLHFDMEDFFHHAENVHYGSQREMILASAHLIDPVEGSCGCALGHAIAAGVDASNYQTWEEFALKAFGVTVDEWPDIFGGELAFVDNTPKAAAARLRVLLTVTA